ncbi:hypothetical protein ACXGQW_00985 [Wenyingzhuangia sp. IMCC45533]
MKKILLTLILLLTLKKSYSQLVGTKEFSKEFYVSSSSPLEVTDLENNSLNSQNIYRIQIVTRNTGTKSGAEYLVWFSNNEWKLRAVNISGKSSNHPLLFIDNNTVKIKTNHNSKYYLRTFIKEIKSHESDVIPNILGSSYQWQREINNLSYIDGNVGIGIEKPTQKLDVSGNIYSSEKIFSKVSLKSKLLEMDDQNSNLIIYRDSDIGDWALLRSNKGGGIGIVGQPDVISLSVSRTNSNVGIGTLNPGDNWKLAVNGKIRAKEIKVETGWADFVFTEKYKLPTLKEVEKHIKEKGHLKDIPTSEDVNLNGILLGEMNSKLLQKIEELTLYTIEQEKKIETLEKKNKILESLLKRIQIIENKLK